MSDKEMKDRIKELEDEIADIKAIQGANEDFKRQIDNEPFGLERLRGARRKEGYPNDTNDEEEDE